MPEQAQRTGGERIRTREAPVITGTLPVQTGTGKKDAASDPLLFPVTPAERYAALLKETGKNNRGGMPQTQLIQRLQTGYGNQYTQKVITGFQGKKQEPVSDLPAPVQTQLTVGRTNDDYEKEAETVAEKLAAGQPVPSISSITPGEKKKSSQPVKKEKKEKEAKEKHTKAPLQKRILQRQEDEEEGETGETPGSAVDAIENKGPGEPMEPSTRRALESGMGVDLGDVRVHSDRAAQEAAGDLNARAFTHENNIWLGEGESPHDLRLMAHEAAHVVQQTGKTRRKLIRRTPEIAAKTKAAAPKESAADVAPGVYDLKGEPKFNPPKTITDWIDKQKRKRGNINVRFGKIARGTVKVIKYRKKYYIRKKHAIPLTHPFFPGTTGESESLQPCLVLHRTRSGSNIKGYIGLKKGKRIPWSPGVLARHIKKNPDLIGLVGFEFKKYPKIINKLEGGSLQIGFSGVTITLGDAFKGTLSLQANDERVTSFEGSSEVKVPGLADGTLNLKRSEKGDVSGEVKIDVNLPKNFSGGVTIIWGTRGITGEGKVGYQGEKLSGNIILKVMEKSKADQLEMEKKPPPKDAKPAPVKRRRRSKKMNYVLFGEGDLTFAFTDWLNGTAHVIADQKGFITIIGEITPQAEIILFKHKPYNKPLFDKKIKWRYGIPVVGSFYIAITADASVFASIGPAKFYNIGVSGTYSTDPKKCKDFTFRGTFNMSAEAGLSAGVGVEAGLELLGHDIGAGGKITVKAGVAGYAEATPILGYREKPGAEGEDKKGEVFIHGDMEIAAQAFLGLGGKLYVELDSPWWSPAPDKTWTWPLFEKRWPIGGSIGIGATIDYIFGSGKYPELKLKPVKFSPDKLVKDACKDRTQGGKGEVKGKKGTWKEKNTRSAAPPAGGGTKGDLQPGKAPAPKTTSRAEPGKTKRVVKPPSPNARTPTGKTVKELQQEAIKKGKKPDAKGIDTGKEGKDTKKKDETKKPNVDKLKEGLRVLDEVTKRYAKDGATKKEVETGVKSVRRKHKVFKSIMVIDGGDSWDYKYTASPPQTHDGPKKKKDIEAEQKRLKSLVGFKEPVYELDTLERAQGPSGHVDKIKKGEKRASMPSKRKLEGGIPAYLPGDHRGHLIGDRFYGPSELANLVPMHRKLNLSTFKKFENSAANEFDKYRNPKDKSVEPKPALLYMKVKPNYPKDVKGDPESYRPETVTASGKVFTLENNKKKEDPIPNAGTFDNPKPGMGG